MPIGQEDAAEIGRTGCLPVLGQDAILSYVSVLDIQLTTARKDGDGDYGFNPPTCAMHG
jgi:hypothetical protein